MIRYDRRSIAHAVGLAALAGYVDALGFLSLDNFFVSFMSGNSTRLGVAMGEGRVSYALYGAGVVGLFVAGVVAGTLVSYRFEQNRRPAVLLLVVVFLVAAVLLFGRGHPHLGTADCSWQWEPRTRCSNARAR